MSKGGDDWLSKLTTPSPSANIRTELGYEADPIFGMSANPALDPNGGTPGSKKGPKIPDPNAAALAEISKKLFEESDPLRVGLIKRSSDFMNGGFDITGTPQFQALKANTDSVFNRAKSNVVGATPAGGALTGALTNLEMGRAVDETQGIGQLTENELNRATGLATGQTPTAISGLGQAANIQSQAAQAEAARNSQNKQGMGQGIGTLLAAFMS